MKVDLQEARLLLEQDPSVLFLKLMAHGSMSVEYYKPGKADLQQPHQQDELYIIAAGEGNFINGAEKYTFQTGDVLFVPAGTPHRFEDYSANFATWVIFYGPNGGEQAALM